MNTDHCLLRIAIILGFMGLFTLCAAGFAELVGYAHWFEDLRGAGCGLSLAFVVVRLFASSKWLRDEVAKVKIIHNGRCH